MSTEPQDPPAEYLRLAIVIPVDGTPSIEINGHSAPMVVDGCSTTLKSKELPFPGDDESNVARMIVSSLFGKACDIVRALDHCDYPDLNHTFGAFDDEAAEELYNKLM